MDWKKNIIILLALLCLLSSCGISVDNKVEKKSPNTECCETTNFDTNVTTIADENSATVVTPSSMDKFKNCIAEFAKNNQTTIIDDITYDIDNDGTDELLILSEGAILNNCRQLHVYKVLNDDFFYCGSIDTLLQSEINMDINNRFSVADSYDKIEVYSFCISDTVKYNCVFMSSVTTAYYQKNYVSAIVLDKNNMVKEIPILSWGIDVNQNYYGELYEQSNVYYPDENCEEKIDDKQLDQYLSLIQLNK